MPCIILNHFSRIFSPQRALQIVLYYVINFVAIFSQTADGTSIKLSQSDKWFKQAGIIDGKIISTTDTGIAFRKIAKYVSFFIILKGQCDKIVPKMSTWSSSLGLN
jgi:hypothetical protein